jgi:hypothetical protein
MKHLALRALSAGALTVLLCACTSHAGGGAAPDHASATATPVTSAVRHCGASALALQYGPQVSPMTGEQAVMYRVRNRGQAACSLSGYPRVTLDTAQGSPLAFHYTDGRSQYVTKAHPKKVILQPGGSAYVLVAKYRCDLGGVASAATIKLALPGNPLIVLTGPVAAPGAPGVASLGYCKGGPNDPGQTVGVSPVEATPGAAGPFTG